MRKLGFEATVIANTLIYRMHDVKKGEVVAITCDSASNHDVALALAEQAHIIGAKPVILYTPKFSGRIALVDKSIDRATFADALSNVDHWIDANFYDFYHSATYEEVMQRNPKIKYFLLGNQCTENLYKVFGGYDFDISEELNEKLTSMFANGKKMHITSRKGTDVKFDINPENLILGTTVSKLPSGGNTLPANFNTWPALESGNGIIVFDRMYEVKPDDIIRSEINVELKDSMIIRAWGNTPQADVIAHKFYTDISSWNDDNAMKIAHVSLGMLPCLREYVEEIVFDERVWASVVWGIGNVGPECAPPIGQISDYHMDGTSQQNSLFLDGEAIIVDDEFVHPELRPIVDRLLNSMM
jgi:leucyl aminopeptidase (aminopeptidase T)